MVKFLLGKGVLSSTPLEVAYAWTLSCSFALYNGLKLGSKLYQFHCRKLLPGRIFEKTDKSNYDATFSQIQAHVLYYVDENSRGKAKHPLFDLYFRSDENELVFIDLTGSKDKYKLTDK